MIKVYIFIALAVLVVQVTIASETDHSHSLSKRSPFLFKPETGTIDEKIYRRLARLEELRGERRGKGIIGGFQNLLRRGEMQRLQEEIYNLEECGLTCCQICQLERRIRELEADVASCHRRK